MTSKDDNYWGDDFEDTVASALIACYETQPKKNKGAAPSDRINDERLAAIRRIGPYIPSNSRVVEINYMQGIDPKQPQFFDMQNDVLPKSGMFAFRPDGEIKKTLPGAYLVILHIKEANSLGKYWKRQSGGKLYEMIQMDAGPAGVNGDRRFFTVSNTGNVLSCYQEMPDRLTGAQGSRTELRNSLQLFPEYVESTTVYSSVALQFLADRRFCWSITAQEKTALAHLGCMKEEIKSLLYARSLPMTDTGRKRPILHLVEAHTRRLRNGTDINIDTFLRGTQIIDMYGTRFTVRPPEVLRPVVSENSQRYFETNEIANHATPA